MAKKSKKIKSQASPHGKEICLKQMEQLRQAILKSVKGGR